MPPQGPSVQDFYGGVFAGFDQRYPEELSNASSRLQFIQALKQGAPFNEENAKAQFNNFFNVIQLEVIGCVNNENQWTEADACLHLKFDDASQIIVGQRFPTKFAVNYNAMPYMAFLSADPRDGRFYCLRPESHITTITESGTVLAIEFLCNQACYRQIGRFGELNTPFLDAGDFSAVRITVAVRWSGPSGNYRRFQNA